MLKRRTILLLAAVLTLGAAFAAPNVSMYRGVEVCAIICVAQQQCERQEVRVATRGNAAVAAAAVYVHPQLPRVHGFTWPASYQRPPTFFSLS
jgi:hypothetical protein